MKGHVVATDTSLSGLRQCFLRAVQRCCRARPCRPEPGHVEWIRTRRGPERSVVTTCCSDASLRLAARAHISDDTSAPTEFDEASVKSPPTPKSAEAEAYRS